MIILKQELMQIKNPYRQANLQNTHQQQFQHEYMFRFTPKKQPITIKNSSPNKNIYTSRYTCSRCNIDNEQTLTKCIECNSALFCQSCDIKVHKIGKFYFHHRNKMKNVNQNESNITSLQSLSVLDNNQSNNKDKDQQNRIKLMMINVSQSWDRIVFQISEKFKQAIDSLKDRRKEILDKIQKKRQQDIKYYQQSVKMQNKGNDYQVRNKKMRRLSTQDLQNTSYNIKLLAPLECKQQKLQKSYKVSLGMFQQLSNLINKLQLKNLLTKSKDQYQISGVMQTSKKPMKSSLIISTGSYTALSPYTKTPTHTKAQLSQSTLQGGSADYQDKFSKIISETKKKNLQLKEQLTLNKVRSQKLIFKSPTNKTENQKVTIKKNNTRMGQ